MKKHLILILLLWIAAIPVYSQILFGDQSTPISPSAAVEVRSQTQGVLFPRMTRAIRTNSNFYGPKGLLVYDSTENRYFYRDGNSWWKLFAQADSTEFLRVLNLNPPIYLNYADTDPFIRFQFSYVDAWDEKLWLRILRPNMRAGQSYGLFFGGNQGGAYWKYRKRADGSVYQSLGFFNNEILTITPEGRVGIGTTNPTANFHVKGTFRYEDGNQAAGKYMLSSSISPFEGAMNWKDLPNYDQYSGSVSFQMANLSLNTTRNNDSLNYQDVYFNQMGIIANPSAAVMYWYYDNPYYNTNYGGFTEIKPELLFTSSKYLVQLEMDVVASAGATNSSGWVQFSFVPKVYGKNANGNLPRNTTLGHSQVFNLPVYIYARAGQTTHISTDWKNFYPRIAYVSYHDGRVAYGYTSQSIPQGYRNDNVQARANEIGLYIGGPPTNPYIIRMTNASFGSNIELQNIRFRFIRLQ